MRAKKAKILRQQMRLVGVAIGEVKYLPMQFRVTKNGRHFYTDTRRLAPTCGRSKYKQNKKVLRANPGKNARDVGTHGCILV